jgi:hypothetical protein
VLDESFGEAWVNSTHRVLGLKLRPFSLWIRFQLELLESPVLTGKLINPLDLERAVRACRLTYPNVISTKVKMWSFRWRLAGREMKKETEKLGAYLQDYFAIPKFVPPVLKKIHDTDPKHPPPEAMRIFSAVATMTGWSENKIWDMPIGQAYWYAAGHWYQSGQELDFLTPEHLVLQERIAKMKAEKTNG